MAFLETLANFCSIVGGTANGYVKLYPDMMSPIHIEQVLVHRNLIFNNVKLYIIRGPCEPRAIITGRQICIFSGGWRVHLRLRRDSIRPTEQNRLAHRRRWNQLPRIYNRRDFRGRFLDEQIKHRAEQFRL